MVATRHRYIVLCRVVKVYYAYNIKRDPKCVFISTPSIYVLCSHPMLNLDALGAVKPAIVTHLHVHRLSLITDIVVFGDPYPNKLPLLGHFNETKRFVVCDKVNSVTQASGTSYGFEVGCE